MSRPPRVALVTNVLAHYRVPGFRELARRLDGGLIVFLLTGDMEHRRYVLAEASDEDLGFESRVLPGRRWRRRPWDDLHWSDLRPVLNGHFDVVIVGGWAEPAYLYLWLRLLGRKTRLLFWIESTARDRSRSRLKEGLKRLLLSRAAGCIVPGRRAAEYCRQLGIAESRVHVALNATDRAFFRERAGRLLPRRAALRSSLGLEHPTFLYAGRMVESIKGVEALIRAVARVESRGTRVTLVLAGDGPDREAYTAFAAELGCRDVRLPGVLDHETLCRWYTAADAFVLPSRSEVWGFVLNEAMEFGLPLVASEAVGAGPELVRTENGFVVPVGDTERLAAALGRLASHPALRRQMGAASRRLIEGFSPGAWAAGVQRAIEAAGPFPPTNRARPKSEPRQNRALPESRSIAARPVVFLNPWDRIIGPNRYLVEMLRGAPDLARRALVISDKDRDSLAEFEGLGCGTATWPEVALLRADLDLRRLVRATWNHTAGLVRLVRRLRSSNPALVVSNTENLWTGGLAARAIGVSHVQIFHAMTVFERLQRRPWLARCYLRSLSALSHRVLSVSEAQAAALRRQGVSTGKIVTIPNPIPVAEIEALGRRPSPEIDTLTGGRRPLLICAGRLGSKKGQDLLIEALPAVCERYPELLCAFAGRRESEEGHAFELQLEKRIEELGLEAHVRFLGERHDLPAWLRRADLYVQPSRTESFGRVVAESLICGTPVVAFATGGLPEVAGPAASLVLPGNVAALGRAIIEGLARKPEEVAELVERGRRHVRESFDARHVVARFKRILHVILE